MPDPTRIKICGITGLEDAELAVEAGAWAVGLILWPGSPRACELDQAELIARTLRRRAEVCGVFVNAPLEEVTGHVDALGLTMVQLHGEEGPAYCDEVRRRTGAQIIKAARVGGGAGMQALEPFHTDFHLLDTFHENLRGGTGETWDWELIQRRRSKVPLIMSGGLTQENVGDAIRVGPAVRRRHGERHGVGAGQEGSGEAHRVRRGRRGGQRRVRRRGRGQARGEGAGPRRRRGRGRREGGRRRGGDMSIASVEHRFGPYGGQYVPETLMPALEELEAAWLDAWRDPGFRAELDDLLTHYAGRPTPLYLAERLSEVAGRPIWLKREDLLHTGAHKLNNALGQGLLARRMGKRRVIAETGAGQHGVGTATACALLGLECVVYMGEEDMRRQRPNVQRMELLGAEVRTVKAGTRTLKEATSEAIRDWVTNVASTHYVIGSAIGPAPYPSIVRELQRVIGDEARAADPRARGPAAGPGRRMRRRRLQRDRHVHGVHRRRGRRAARRRGGRRGP